MELTIDYKGKTQVNPDLSGAINASKNASIYDALNGISSQATSINNAKLDVQNATKLANDKMVLALQEKQAKQKADDDKFRDISTASIDSREFNGMLGSLSDAEKRDTLEAKMRENINEVKQGTKSEHYVTTFNNALNESYSSAIKGAQAEFDRNTINVRSEEYSNLDEASKVAYINHLKGSNLSNDVIEGVTIGGAIKGLTRDISSKTSMTPEEQQNLALKISTLNDDILKTGKDPESSPQLKAWMGQLTEAKKTIEKKTLESAQMELIKDIGDKNDLNNSYLKNKSINDFNVLFPNDASKAYEEFQKYSLEKYSNDLARDMRANPDKYSEFDKEKMLSENKAYKNLIVPEIASDIISKSSKGDFSSANSTIIKHKDIAKDTVGKQLLSDFTRFSDVSKDAPEVVTKKEQELSNIISTFDMHKEALNGVEASKILYGDRYEQLNAISNMTTYLGFDNLTANKKYNEMMTKGGPNATFENSISQYIFEQTNEDTDRDELQKTFAIMNTVMPTALTEEMIDSVIDKHKSGDLVLSDKLTYRSKGFVIDQRYASHVNDYVQSQFPSATQITGDKNYVTFYDNNGAIGKVPTSEVQGKLKNFDKTILSIATNQSNSFGSKAGKVGTSLLDRAYGLATKATVNTYDFAKDKGVLAIAPMVAPFMAVEGIYSNSIDYLSNFGTAVHEGFTDELKATAKAYYKMSKDTKNVSALDRESALAKYKQASDRLKTAVGNEAYESLLMDINQL